MRKQVIGNWKMNGSIAQLGEVLASIKDEHFDLDASVALPFVYLQAAQALLAGTSIKVGAQTVSEYLNGAYTGEVSATMLKDIACDFALLGHSERRHVFGETEAAIAVKLQRLQEQSIYTVFCVGETLLERDAGVAEASIARQLAPLLEVGVDLHKCCVAYEPVWAIGTGRAASEEQISAMHAFIKGHLNTACAVLYGGSVKASNAANILNLPGVDGVLVGGASLNAAEFGGICRAVKER